MGMRKLRNYFTEPQPMQLETSNILGVGVSAINMGIAIEQINNWIDAREKHYVCVTGVHGVMESQRDENLRQIHNAAGMVTPDGMPLVWLSRWYGHKHVERVYGPDLLLAVCERSLQAGWSHYFMGGGPGVADTLIMKLKERFPGIKLAGSYCPPFRPLTEVEDNTMVDEINQSKADLIWVGLSTPKQEYWMAKHLGKINAPVMIGVGAAFDFHAGLKKQAPHWMQRSGLEWFYRLLSEPERLWRRYLTNNPAFVLLILAQLLKIRKSPEITDAKTKQSLVDQR